MEQLERNPYPTLSHFVGEGARRAGEGPRRAVGAIFLLLALLVPARAQDDVPDLAEQGQALLEQSRLRALHAQYLAVWQQLDPEAASRLGLHDYDNRLSSREEAVVKKLSQLDERFLLRLRAEVHAERLQGPDVLDYELFRRGLELDAFERGLADSRRRRPQDYLALGGVLDVLQKEYAGYPGRAADALTRLEQLPGLLKQARATLASPPRLWTERTIADCAGALAFLREVPAFYKPLYPSDALLEQRVQDAVAKARDAVEGYRTFLKESLLPRSTGDAAIGREAYERLLRERHGLDMSASSVESLGRGEMRRAARALKRAAREIDPARDVHALLAEAGKEQPKPKALAPFMKAQADRAYDDLIRKNLVPLQAGALRVLETPAFLRSAVPLTVYAPPASMDADAGGALLVTPIDPALSQTERAALGARLYNEHELENAVNGAAWPGRHLQALLAKRQPSPIRRWYATPVFSEGWGLYAEGLAHEAGEFKSELTRLTLLRRRRMFAALAVLDVRLHAKGQDFEEGVRFLKEEAELPEPKARAYALLVSERPTWGMAAITGCVEIERLREHWQRRLGSAFKLKEFHDRLLGYGALPLSDIAKELDRDWPKPE